MLLVGSQLGRTQVLKTSHVGIFLGAGGIFEEFQQGGKIYGLQSSPWPWWVEGRGLETVSQAGICREGGETSREETQVRKYTGEQACSCKKPGCLEEKGMLRVWGEG